MRGLKYGYYPNNLKTILVLKDPSDTQEAKRLFENTGIKIVSNGERHLGAVIGSKDHKEQYVSEKITKWIQDLRQLTEIAKDEPHAAYVAFTKGLAPRWGFTQRTIGDIGHLFAPLEKVIKEEFIPSLTERTVSVLERVIMELPVRMGGLGIQNPEKNSHRV